MRRSLLILLFLTVFIGSLIASVPLGFVLQQAGLKERGVDYRHTAGTIWNGKVHDILVAGQPIGDVSFKTQPLALVGGALAVNLNVDGPAGAGRGKARVGLDRAIMVTDLVADIDVQGLSRLEPRLRQAPARLSATIKTLRLSSNGACRAADGTLQTDILKALGGRYAWEGPVLSGTLSCDADQLLVALENQGGEDAIHANGRIAPGGIYTVDARVTSENVGVVQALQTLEFRNRNGAYEYYRTNQQTAASEEPSQE